MNNQDLLDLIGHARDNHILEASQIKKNAAPRSHSPGRKKLLMIAAVLAMMMLLAGCVAVFLRLQDMTIAKGTYTQKHDDQGHLLEAPVEKEYDIFTFCGSKDSPARQASREWYEFTQSYDPGDLGNEPNLPNIPDQYEYTYECWTPEMVAKLDEIAAKYNLKLLDTRCGFQRGQSQLVMDAIGVKSLYCAGANVKEEPYVGMVYPPNNLRLYFGLTLTGEDALWTTPVRGTYYYSQNGYMPIPYYQSFESDLTQQWDYTAADGTRLLLALANNGRGFIVAERADATIGIQLDISLNYQMYEELEAPTPEVLQQLADAFDYSIHPQVADGAALAQTIAEAEAAEQASFVLPDVHYGGFDSYLQENAVYLRDDYYTYYDLDNDGQEDLLIGSGNGSFDRVLLPKDGEIVETNDGSLYLMEDGRLCEYWMEEALNVYAPYSDTQLVTLNEEGDVPYLQLGENALRYFLGDEGWYKSGANWQTDPTDYSLVEEAEVQAFLAEHPFVQFTWTPIRDYPLASGKTVGQLLEELDVPLTEEELIKAYANWAKDWTDTYSRYTLRDVNNDGVLDLLVSGDGLADFDPISTTYYWTAVTWRYGMALGLSTHDFYICEDGVLECYSYSFDISQQAPYNKEEHHRFVRLDGDTETELDYVIYCRGDDSWISGWDRSPLSTAEAEAILAKHPRLDQEMKPLSELIG